MRFQCPFCRGIVAVDNSDLGIDVQCGHCHEIVTVPTSRVATGSVISDFIVLEELGRGGMGVVYLAYQISLDRSAAVKILADNYANNAEFITGFIKEARAAAKLNHPHIVQAYAVGEDDGVFYFAMENVDGETMKEVLKREKIIPVDQALMIIQQIAEALDYAWKEQRLIHRDIKPDNIMLTKKGRAKLADLGLARVAGDVDDEDGDEVMGTPQYISPEHLTGAPMDIRSDIYSLGATLYHLITAKFPFEGKTATEIARKHLEMKLTPPHLVNNEVPETVSYIVEKMMAKNPKHRYQDAEELVDDLRMARRGKRPLGSTSRSMSKQGGGKKTVFLNTKTGKKGVGTASGAITGRFQKTSSTKTGMKKVRSSSSAINVNVPDEVKSKEEKAKKQIILWIVACTLITICAIAYAVVKMSSIDNSSKIPDKKVVKTPTTSAFTKKVSMLAKQAKNSSMDLTTTFDECAALLKNPGKLKYKCDVEAYEKLKGIYTKLDNELVKPIREKLRKAHLQAIQKLKAEEEMAELNKKQREERKKREQAEKERKKKEEEKRKKREAAAAKQAVELYKESIVTMKNSIRKQIVIYSKNHEYAEAIKLFDQMPQVDKNYQNNIEIRSAKSDFNEWKNKLKSSVSTAQAVWKNIYDSKTKLKDLQLELNRKLWKVVDINKDVVKVAFGPNVKVDFKFAKIPPSQMKKIVNRAADKTQLEDAAFHYALLSGNIPLAIKIAPDPEWKKEVYAIYKTFKTN